LLNFSCNNVREKQQAGIVKSLVERVAKDSDTAFNLSVPRFQDGIGTLAVFATNAVRLPRLHRAGPSAFLDKFDLLMNWGAKVSQWDFLGADQHFFSEILTNKN